MVESVLREPAAQPNVVRVSLQTNGVRLDNDWLDLSDAMMPTLQIGVSLDGDGDGNSWRVGYDAKPTYPLVVKALRLLAARQRKVGVSAAVTSRSVGRAEVPVGTAGSAYAGPGYLMTIDLNSGRAPITQLVLDLERAPALCYQLLNVGRA